MLNALIIMVKEMQKVETELINKRTFVMVCRREIIISQRREKKPYVSVIFLDRNDLRRINSLAKIYPFQ